jgi:hypothetical protein
MAVTFWGIGQLRAPRAGCRGVSGCRSPLRILAPTLLAVWLVAASSGPASAQQPPDSRVSITLSGAYQPSAKRFSQAITFEQYGEEGSLAVDHAAKRGPVVDAGMVVRLWRCVGLGVSGSYFRGSNAAQVSALVPHPFFVNRPRQISGPASTSVTQLGLHVQVAYWVKATDRLEIVFSGGPSVIRVDQDFVSDVTFTQVFPYDTATYAGAAVLRRRKTARGGNLGAEIDWRAAGRVGLAAVVRFSRAIADFPETGAPPLVLGGLRIGGGVRLLF